MSHSDDNGLVLPPRLAPQHVVLMPIYRNDQEKAQVLPYVEALFKDLKAQLYDGQPVRVRLDYRDNLRGGEKAWEHIKRGIPLRVEVGPRDMAKDSVFVGRRDKEPKEKISLGRNEFVQNIAGLLTEIQNNLYAKAKALRDSSMKPVNSLKEFEEFFGGEKSANETSLAPGFALSHWNEAAIGHEVLAKYKVTPRCIPLGMSDEPGTCIFTGKPSAKRVVFAKAY